MLKGSKIVADTQLVKIIEQDFDAIVLPGGLKGAEAFRDNPLIIEKFANPIIRVTSLPPFVPCQQLY